MSKSQSLVLTKELIIEKCKKENFNEIKNVNLWGNDLADMSMIRQLPNIEVVSLSVNKISTLVDFSYCPKIQELYLRKNQIQDIREVRHLSNLKNLKVLWLSDNPCSSIENYRLYTIKMLPQLIKIDSHEITDDERQAALKINFEGLSKVPSNRNILQQNLMSQNNAKQQMNKSPLRDGSHPNTGSQSKLESIRSGKDDGRSVGSQQRIQNMQNNRQQNSQSAHAARNNGQASFNQGVASAHNQSVQNNVRSAQGVNNENVNINHSHSHSISNNQQSSTHRNENILCAVLALIKELSESELELIKRDIEKKLQVQQNKQTKH